ncbi:MAG: hypothetical protein ACO3UU_15150 [Minisyncoccia bacterium]
MPSNPWLSHVAQFRQANPDVKYKDALKAAKATYKQTAVVAPVVEVPVKKTKKSNQTEQVFQ